MDLKIGNRVITVSGGYWIEAREIGLRNDRVAREGEIGIITNIKPVYRQRKDFQHRRWRYLINIRR